MKSGKIILGMIAGAAIGAALGILFAPEKGSSTRKKMAKKSKEYTDQLEDNFNEFVGNVSKKFDTLKEEANSIVDNVRHKIKKNDV